jgi:hypothetical protein
MGIPVLRGRSFGREDQETSVPVVIIDRPFAERYYPHIDPIGHHLSMYEGSDTYAQREIVGVVDGIRHDSLRRAPAPTLYIPYTQTHQNSLYLVVKSTLNAGAVTSALRDVVARENPTIAIQDMQEMGDIVSTSGSADRLVAWLFAGFALVSLVLATAGVYGVFAKVVEQETREMGVRLALGAMPRHVAGTVIGRGLGVASVGLGLGGAMAFLVTRMLARWLFEIDPHDVATFVASTLALGAVAVTACAVPARRASRLDPAVTLRYE